MLCADKQFRTELANCSFHRSAHMRSNLAARESAGQQTAAEALLRRIQQSWRIDESSDGPGSSTSTEAAKLQLPCKLGSSQATVHISLLHR